MGFGGIGWPAFDEAFFLERRPPLLFTTSSLGDEKRGARARAGGRIQSASDESAEVRGFKKIVPLPAGSSLSAR